MTHKADSVNRSVGGVLNLGLLADTWRNLLRRKRVQAGFVVAFTLWLVGAVESVQSSSGQQPDPRFWMIIAIVITAYSGTRAFRLSPDLERAGASGRAINPAMREIVRRIQAAGMSVYRESEDQTRDGAYVLVGPAGIFSMKVKARKVFGSGTIGFRKGNELVLGGRIADARAVKEAKAIAGNLSDRISAVVRRAAAVKPLVVFCNGWQINRPNDNTDVSVLNANELGRYFETQQPVLSPSELDEVASLFGNPLPAAS